MSETEETEVRHTEEEIKLRFPPKNQRSPIWRYFEPVSKRNTKCLLCSQVYQNSGNTTNLIDHLKRKHKEEHAKVLGKMKASKESSSLVIPVTMVTRVEDKNAIADAPVTVEAIKYESGGEQSEEVDSIQLEISEEASAAIITTEVVEQEGVTDEIQPRKIMKIETGNYVIQTDEGPQDIQMCKIIPLPHARSEVWHYFGFVADPEGNILDRSKVVCKLCSISFCYSGNTTNFYSHLKSMHSEVKMRSVAVKSTRSAKRTYFSVEANSEDEYDMSSPSIGEQEASMADDGSIPPRSRADLIHVDDITQSIVDFLVTDCRPLAVTQGKGFHQMLRLLAPGYALPDKAKLAHAVRRKYDNMRKEREQGAHDQMSTMDY